MSDSQTAAFPSTLATPSLPGRFVSIGLAIILIATLGLAAFETRARTLTWLDDAESWPILFTSVIIALLPAAICFSQTVTRKRLINKLKSVNDLQISNTVYYTSASRAFESIVPAAITGDYLFPLFMNIVTNFLLFLAIFVGFTFKGLIDFPNAILLGIQPQTPNFDIAAYQSGTFAVMAAAFLGNYIYTLSQLLSRVNNNDLFPISLHFYSSRSIIAMTTACIMRHSMNALHITDSDAILLLGFAAGLAPDLLIVALSRRAFQYLKVWSAREDPKPGFQPTSLSLLVIDDLTRDKIDRLSELGIDSAHALSRQNPFIIWAKLPYDLGLIIDWIAQAQLYVIVRDEAMANLRKILITDIFDFIIRLDTDEAATILTTAGLNPTAAAGLKKQFSTDEAYKRLLQVRQALLPENYAGTAAPASSGPTLQAVA